ncbi:MAG TPA: HlyD family secretion protein [Prolixibacteraceae bacterium]|nr:HlyD family secretion protein [Prolixibacteraceae bacterium]
MKTKYISILVFAALAACTGNNEKSDAFGNFETTETIVSAESPGKIISMNAEQGDMLTKGQLIGMTDTTQLFFSIEQLKAQMEATSVKKVNVSAQIDVLNEQLKNLKVDQQRVQKLYDEKAATRKDLDFIDGKVNEMQKQIASVKTQFQMIDRETDVLNSQLVKTEDLKEKCKIISPVDGTVLEKYLEQGEITSVGKPVVKVADLSILDLKVYISGDQLPMVKIRQEVTVIIDKTAKENQSLKGTVKWLSPEAEFTPKIIQTKEERVKQVYAMKVAVKNDGRLKIGMPGEVKF